ncbi:hypothetical protein AVEN_266634-1, partial [Araneus ventricosus]
GVKVQENSLSQLGWKLGGKKSGGGREWLIPDPEAPELLLSIY